LTSASHFVGPAVFGLSLAGADLTNAGTLLYLAAFTLWGAASHAFGAVQDVRADREGGISSIATAIGARATVRFAWMAYLAAGILISFTGSSWLYLAALPYLVIVGRFWNITDDNCEDANKGWKLFIWLNFLAGTMVTFAWI
jgi:4-hydroxybenzoate polyprenyltransferase